MNGIRQKRGLRKGAFTIIEMLVVISIMATLSGLVLWGVTRAAAARKLNRVRVELKQLEAVIDAYHEKFGFYPPDNTNDCTKPPLFYELTGTTNRSFIDVTKEDFVTVKGDFPTHAMINQTFCVGGFANSNPETVKNFFPEMTGAQHRTVTNIQATPIVRLDVLVVPVSGPPELEFPSYDDDPRPLNTWRYVSTRPTNNPASYDLWADIKIGTKIHTIGNWKE